MPTCEIPCYDGYSQIPINDETSPLCHFAEYDEYMAFYAGPRCLDFGRYYQTACSDRVGALYYYEVVELIKPCSAYVFYGELCEHD